LWLPYQRIILLFRQAITILDRLLGRYHLPMVIMDKDFITVSSLYALAYAKELHNEFARMRA